MPDQTLAIQSMHEMLSAAGSLKSCTYTCYAPEDRCQDPCTAQHRTKRGKTIGAWASASCPPAWAWAGASAQARAPCWASHLCARAPRPVVWTAVRPAGWPGLRSKKDFFFFFLSFFLVRLVTGSRLLSGPNSRHFSNINKLARSCFSFDPYIVSSNAYKQKGQLVEGVWTKNSTIIVESW